MKTTYLAALTLALLSTGTKNANAYVTRSTGDATLHWNQSPVRVTAGSSLAAIGSAATKAVSAAFGTWAAVSGSGAPDVVVDEGSVDAIGYRIGADNQNTVRFLPEGSDLGKGALAFTVVTFNVGGTILDADVIVNGSASRPFAVLPTTGFAGPYTDHDAYDLQDIVTHEIGHFYGLGDNVADSSVTMFKTAARRELRKRVLSADDEAGLRFLYQGSAVSSTASCAARPGAESGGWLGAVMIAAGLCAAWRARGSRAPLAVPAAVFASALALASAATAAPSPGAGDSAASAETLGRIVAVHARWEGGVIVSELVAQRSTCEGATCATESVEVYGGVVGDIGQVVGHDPVPAIGSVVPFRFSGRPE